MTQSEINSATSEPSGVKKIKRPAFQFYPSDWLSDTALRMCSEGARGIWMDMICYMHEGTPYGHLKVNHKVILPQTLARMVGCELSSLEGYLSELVTAGVVQVDADGCMFSKRMVKDEALRNARAAGGKLGGNPKLTDDKVNLEDNLKSSGKVNLNLTPSSSSSSSENITDTNVSVVEAKASPACPHLEIIAAYNRILPELQHVIPDRWSGARADALKSRWRESPKHQSLQFWERFFTELRRWPFYMGENDRQWKADLGWIVKRSNFDKLIEKFTSARKAA